MPLILARRLAAAVFVVTLILITHDAKKLPGAPERWIPPAFDGVVAWALIGSAAAYVVIWRVLPKLAARRARRA